MADAGYATPTIINIADFQEDTRATFLHLRTEQWRSAVEDIPALEVRGIDLDPEHLGGAMEFRHLRGADGVLIWGAGGGPFAAGATIELLEPRLEDGRVSFMPARDLPERHPIPRIPDDGRPLIPPPPAPCRVVFDRSFKLTCHSRDCSRCAPLLVGYPGGGVVTCWCADIVLDR